MHDILRNFIFIYTNVCFKYLKFHIFMRSVTYEWKRNCFIFCCNYVDLKTHFGCYWRCWHKNGHNFFFFCVQANKLNGVGHEGYNCTYKKHAIDYLFKIRVVMGLQIKIKLRELCQSLISGLMLLPLRNYIARGKRNRIIRLQIEMERIHNVVRTSITNESAAALLYDQ